MSAPVRRVLFCSSRRAQFTMRKDETMDKEVHPLVQLAHRTIEAYILQGRKLNPPAPEESTPEMCERVGIFVTLYEFGELARLYRHLSAATFECGGRNHRERDRFSYV